jgi:hypothetical protein
MGSDYQTALRKLANHACLPNTTLPIEESLVGSLWLVDKRSESPSWEKHTDDVLECLRTANFFFNGPDPNSRNGRADHSEICDLAYFVSRVITGGLGYHLAWSGNDRFDEDSLRSLEQCIYKISYAWDHLLASDMTDLLEGFSVP